MMTPFRSSPGGGAHVTEKDVVEVPAIVMLVGGALGAVKHDSYVNNCILHSQSYTTYELLASVFPLGERRALVRR